MIDTPQNGAFIILYDPAGNAKQVYALKRIICFQPLELKGPQPGWVMEAIGNEILVGGNLVFDTPYHLEEDAWNALIDLLQGRILERPGERDPDDPGADTPFG